MEAIVTVIVVAAVIWYLGGAINSILRGSGELASTEFELIRDEQQVRVQKSYNDLGKKLADLENNSSYTKHTVKTMINKMNTGETNA